MRPVPTSIAVKLEAAAELIAERGLADTKIDDIAAVTGVPRATLYYYFAGKEEILAHLLRDSLRAMGDAIAIAADEPGSAAERLQGVIGAQVRVMNEHSARSKALLLEFGRVARVSELNAVLQSAYYEPVAALLREGVADGTLSGAAGNEDAVTAVFGAVTITGLQYLVQGRTIPPSVAKRLARQLIDGLG